MCIYRMSYESGPMIPFCFFLFVSSFVRVWDANLIESTGLKKSTFTNIGQRDETVCRFKMFKLVMQNFLLIEPMMPFFFFLLGICKLFTWFKVLT